MNVRVPIKPARMETQPSRRWLLCVWALVLSYFVAGVFGRFPWKADEPYSFGIAWEMVEDHQWLIPQVADQPFVEKPPLVYWVAAAFIKAIPAVAAHESARLAVLLFIAIAAAALYATAKHLFQEAQPWLQFVQTRDRGSYSSGADLDRHAYATLGLLLMVGTLGFAEHIHKLTADIGQLTGTVLGLCGLTYIGMSDAPGFDARTARRSSVVGGLMLGTGAGVAFMSKGLLVPGILSTTCLCLLFLPAYRSRRARLAFTIAAAVALLWFVVWPALFYAASPELFDEWLWGHNIGRFLGSTLLGGNQRTLANKVGVALTIGFPALMLVPFVAWHTFRGAGRTDMDSHWEVLRDAPGHVGVAVFLLVSATVLGISASMRDIYLLPLLPAMVLLGLPALFLSPFALLRVARNVVAIAFGAMAILVVAIWLGLATTGNLTWLAWLGPFLGQMLPLPYRLAMNWEAIIIAMAAIIVWAFILRGDVLRSLTIVWCAGFAMLWVVATALLLPWIDAAKSYREVFSEFAPLLATSKTCVATLNLGESELAMLEYVTRAEVTRGSLGHSGSGKRENPNPAARDCDWLLALSNRKTLPMNLDPARWTAVRTASRPAHENELFTLYRTAESSESQTDHNLNLPGSDH